MRVKLKDPQGDVEQFQYGEDYCIAFYGTSSCLYFTHTRKKVVQMKDVGAKGNLTRRATISKRELKQLLNDTDSVQWVVRANRNVKEAVT